jgi:hypothetical protein
MAAHPPVRCVRSGVTARLAGSTLLPRAYVTGRVKAFEAAQRAKAKAARGAEPEVQSDMWTYLGRECAASARDCTRVRQHARARPLHVDARVHSTNTCTGVSAPRSFAHTYPHQGVLHCPPVPTLSK